MAPISIITSSLMYTPDLHQGHACHGLFCYVTPAPSQAWDRTQLTICALPMAPDWRATSRPPRNSTIVGML